MIHKLSVMNFIFKQSSNDDTCSSRNSMLRTPMVDSCGGVTSRIPGEASSKGDGITAGDKSFERPIARGREGVRVWKRKEVKIKKRKFAFYKISNTDVLLSIRYVPK